MFVFVVVSVRDRHTKFQKIVEKTQPPVGPQKTELERSQPRQRPEVEKADRFRKMQERYWAQREEKEKLKLTLSLKGAQSNEKAGSDTSSPGSGAAHEQSKKDLLDTVISDDRKNPLLTHNKLGSVKSQKDYISSLTKLIRQQILSPKGKKL